MSGILEHNRVWTQLFDHARGRPPGEDARGTEPSSSPPGGQDRYGGRGLKVRVLVVFDDDYRSYRETIAVAIQELRPHAEVEIAEASSFGAEATRMAPHLIIGGGYVPGELASTPAWIRLSSEPEGPATVYLDGHLSEAANPTLDDLVSLFDKVETLTR